MKGAGGVRRELSAKALEHLGEFERQYRHAPSDLEAATSPAAEAC